MCQLDAGKRAEQLFEIRIRFLHCAALLKKFDADGVAHRAHFAHLRTVIYPRRNHQYFIFLDEKILVCLDMKHTLRYDMQFNIGMVVRNRLLFFVYFRIGKRIIERDTKFSISDGKAHSFKQPIFTHVLPRPGSKQHFRAPFYPAVSYP